MEELKKLTDDLLNTQNFYKNYFRKEIQFTLKEVVDYIFNNNLEINFIDKKIVTDRDNVYLLKENKYYLLVETERNIKWSEEKFTDLAQAISKKIEIFARLFYAHFHKK